MANTLNSLIPSLFESLDVVSREHSGFINSVIRDSGVERAALNESVLVPVAPAATITDITPATNSPDDGDQVISNVPVTITKARRAPFRWEGEESLGVNNGPGGGNIRAAQMTQAIRGLVNEMESDLGGLYIAASRATGSAGTSPFASNLSDSANVRQLLADNGSPLSDLQMVLDTTAGTNLRSLTQLTNVQQAGAVDTLRGGDLLPLHGFGVRESAGVASHAKGTGSGYLVNNVAGYAVGDTSIALDTGSGTVLAGDVVTFAGDTNKYLVTTGITAPGSIVIAEPGLKKALANNAACTVGASYTANMAFSKSAIVLATRAPALPDGGDGAKDRLLVTDPNTGLSFEVAMYGEYRRMKYEVSAAWGFAVIKPEHCAVLLG